MIKFSSIEIEGFGSIIAPLKYKLKEPGLNIISGGNGSGKTTIMNAFFWVGWGKLVKPHKSSITPWPHVIDPTYKGTKVTLKFSDGKKVYKIIRCSEYKPKVLGSPGKNRLIILEDGEPLSAPNLRDKADYQEWIINKIGYSFNLLKSTIFLSQELENIMSETGPNKKRIFDEAFETTFINAAKDLVSSKLDSQLLDLIKYQNTLEFSRIGKLGVNNEIKAIKQALKHYEEEKKGVQAEIDRDVQDLENQIKKKSTELEVLIGVDGKKEKIYDQELASSQRTIDRYQRFKSTNKGKVEHSEREVARLLSLISQRKGTCSHCGGKISIKTVKKLLKSTKKELKQEKLALKDSITQLEQNLYSLTVIKKSQNELIQLRDILKREIDQLRTSISEKKKNTEYLSKMKPPDTSKLVTLKRDRKKYKVKIKELHANIKSLKKEISINKWLIKDPLSNSGLKAFIFDSMLIRVNNQLKKYTNIVGFGINVFVDMSSSNKDIRISILRCGDEVPYEDLSRGQKQLVNVVLSFALSDVMQFLKPVNCLFLDELFESLSKENIEKVGNIIKEKSLTKSIHLITHLSEFTPSNANILKLGLNERNQTEIIH